MGKLIWNLASQAESTVRESVIDGVGFDGTTGAALAARLSPGKMSPPELESSAATSLILFSASGGHSVDEVLRLIGIGAFSSL